MASLEQVQQDIQTLPQEALDLVAQFVQRLKKVALLSPKVHLLPNHLLPRKLQIGLISLDAYLLKKIYQSITRPTWQRGGTKIW